MKTTQFDRQVLKSIANDINTALASVASKYGIQLKYHGARYTPTSATIKVEASTIGEGGVVNNPERENFIKYAELLHQLDPKMLDNTIKLAHGTYTIIGLNTRAGKFPILGRREDGSGRVFKLGIMAAKLAWQREHPAVPAAK